MTNLQLKHLINTFRNQLKLIINLYVLIYCQMKKRMNRNLPKTLKGKKKSKNNMK